MSSVDWQQQPGSLPPGSSPAGAQGRPVWKLVILLIILIALGWVLLLIAQYCLTGDRISQLPGVPGPIAELFNKPSFENVESINGLQNPMGVAVSPKGGVYVSDRSASAIFIFSPDGVPQGRVTPPAGLEDWDPLGLTFDKAGNLYVADVTPEKHRVLVLSPTPAATIRIDPVLARALPESILKLSFGSQGEEDGQFWFPNGIAVDSKGRIYVAA